MVNPYQFPSLQNCVANSYEGVPLKDEKFLQHLYALFLEGHGAAFIHWNDNRTLDGAWTCTTKRGEDGRLYGTFNQVSKHEYRADDDPFLKFYRDTE